ncbi:hypothetical protein [Macrococcus lamae]|uniref:DUF805 domain-containing protein n=1 Tax=Macrococcus lamae TaxID=198484 RepID=A0A4R6BUA5_9STAP|nr:hypothetical protein [Macrococcus lamae]TDM10638.1 hypothetical protein ERX29_06225 [Macrococcus lamae]
MNRSITWKNVWRDYTCNLFKPKASISVEMYRKHKWLILPFIFILIVVWIYFTFQSPMNKDSYWNLPAEKQKIIDSAESFKTGIAFVILYSALFLCTFTSEMRMFHQRNKDTLPYILANILFLVLGLLYCFVMHMLNRHVSMLPLIVGMWIIIFMMNTGYAERQIKGNVRHDRPF